MIVILNILRGHLAMKHGVFEDALKKIITSSFECEECDTKSKG